MTLKLGMQHWVLQYYQVCSNDPGLTLSYFMARLNLVHYAFVWEKGKTTFSNFFFLETAWPIETKFHLEPPWNGRMKVCITGQSHMTKMAIMPLKKNFSEIKRLITLKLVMQHRVLEYYQVCSNDDPGLTLTYFTARSNLVPYAFVWVKGKTIIFQKLL